jgi:beta-fructofuranosidase
MDYTQHLHAHYRPKKGWINDPNGLVYFKGYYHVFYQHAPDFEEPWHQPMHWGHARTRDFLTWEELPIALFPDRDYDKDGCWSGTATVKDGVLYLLYASVCDGKKTQTVSVAYSEDGIHFKKYENNPVIAHYPADGCPDFRDPAVCRVGDVFYCVMASGHSETQTARLLLYKSADLFHWEYVGVMCQWENAKYAECPSLLPAGDRFLLTASVVPLDGRHYFSVMYGDFEEGKFTVRHQAEVDRGPDQYAGQAFRDPLGRNILISWVPGWAYAGWAEKDVGCLSVPRALKCENGRITAYPIQEFRHLLADSDPALTRTEDGFVIEREGRAPVVYTGESRDLAILRDGYLLEVFVRGGEEVYTALL